MIYIGCLGFNWKHFLTTFVAENLLLNMILYSFSIMMKKILKVINVSMYA